MPAIITLTFNPAIDKSSSVSQLIADKKLKCTPPTYEPGGGGINVARAIRKLGGNAMAVFLAGGYTGKKFAELLAEENVDYYAIDIVNNTRESLVILETDSNKQFRFGMPGPAVLEGEWKACLKYIGKLENVEYIVVSGSLPQGIPVNVYADIALVAKDKNARLIVDTSGEGLAMAVQTGVYLIKPNLGELSRLIGKERLEKDSVEEAARELIEMSATEIVVVSMGAEGAMLVTKEQTVRATPPSVERKSTVGAGDCMVAGLISSLLAGKSLEETVCYGVACGTAATMNPGTALCEKQDVEYLYKQIKQQQHEVL